MENAVQLQNLSLFQGRKRILEQISAQAPIGTFTAILGENGAGKTSLLDVLMGFRKPLATDSVQVWRGNPWQDNFQDRAEIAYLAEKVDVPGAWTVGELLAFHHKFYPRYSLERQRDLVHRFQLDLNARTGDLSAGQVRRAQVVAALSHLPKLIIVDEITALLDIVGRRKFLEILTELKKSEGATILFATNIIEDLADHADRLWLLRQGKLVSELSLVDFLAKENESSLLRAVANALDR